jgi:hypothetical protein
MCKSAESQKPHTLVGCKYPLRMQYRYRMNQLVTVTGFLLKFSLFNSSDNGFLADVLSSFSIGPDFLQWIREFIVLDQFFSVNYIVLEYFRLSP